MKVALVTSMYAPHVIGGAELVAQSQAEALAERGHSVEVLTLGPPGSGVVRSEMTGVQIVRFGIANSYLPGIEPQSPAAKVVWHLRDVGNRAMAQSAHAELARLQPDVVVCHNIYGWSASVWRTVKSLGLPLVQVLHDQYLRCVRSNMFRTSRCIKPCVSCRVLRLPHKRLSRLPDAVVGVSRYILDSLTTAGYFTDVPLHAHVHNISRVDTRLQSIPPLVAPEPVFGYIGSLTPGKGIELLLSDFLQSSRRDWRLLVAGTGDPRYVAELHAAYSDDRVRFMGWQEPGSFYPLVDATVVPSLLDEALGNVVFESMIHGRPVIASRRGGIPELVQENVNGLLFEPAEPGQILAMLEQFASNLATWRVRSARIKASACALHCDRQAWAERWEDMLAEAMHRSRESQAGRKRSA